MIGLITLQRNNLLLRVIDVSITVTQVSTQCPYPIYQLCVFPPNLPVVCVLPPNLPVVCVSTQFTSCVCFHPIDQLCVCFHPIYQLYVCFHPIYQLWVFPPYLPVVSVSTLYTGCVCVYVCVFPPYIPAVCVPIFCFYQILTAFNKLKIMSEIPHNKWQLKRCHNYSHKLIFNRGDNRLACFNRGTQNYGLWQLILLIHSINLNMKLIASLMLTSRVTM